MSQPSPYAITTFNPATRKTEVIYDPLPHQHAFHLSEAPNCLMGGGRGSGKSLAIRMDAISRCLRTPHIRVLVLRREMPELRRTHLAELPLELTRLGFDADKVFLKTTNVVNFPNGSVLEFGHAEDDDAVLKYLSAQYDAIYFDELASFTLEPHRHIQRHRKRCRSVTAYPSR